MEERNLSILIVEDNRGDIFLIQTALNELGVAFTAEVEVNGLQAWERLERVWSNEEPRPALVILDLNVPGMTGREILEKLQEERMLADLPICVFTGAQLERGIVEQFSALNLHFEIKPGNLNELREMNRPLPLPVNSTATGNFFPGPGRWGLGRLFSRRG